MLPCRSRERNTPERTLVWGNANVTVAPAVLEDA